MNHRATQHPVLDWLNRHSSKIAYVGLAAVVALAFWLNDHNQKVDEKNRCISAIDSRNASRSIVENVYQLAIGSIQRDVNSPPLTREQVKQYNKYIARVNAFRETTYALIKPSDICEQYVPDDNVKPPTPPTPPLKYKEVP